MSYEKDDNEDDIKMNKKKLMKLTSLAQNTYIIVTINSIYFINDGIF
jgi:hypothetical protein